MEKNAAVHVFMVALIIARLRVERVSVLNKMDYEIP
jgi:hypothetical protein